MERRRVAQEPAIVSHGVAVGNVSLGRIEHRHDTAWVSYWVRESHRGRGLATRSVVTLASWAFGDGGLFRLELGHRVDNPASGRVARAAGFTHEGSQRSKLRYGSDRFDCESYARLATDAVPDVSALSLTLG